MQPFLMFQDGHAEKAMNLYVSLFDDGEILDVTRWQKGEQGAEGSIKLARFRAAGQSVSTSDSPLRHGFDFTPSWSFFVDCASGEEQERLFADLSEGGKTLMPLDDYGFSKRFAWIADRFGVSWLLIFPDVSRYPYQKGDNHEDRDQPQLPGAMPRGVRVLRQSPRRDHQGGHTL